MGPQRGSAGVRVDYDENWNEVVSRAIQVTPAGRRSAGHLRRARFDLGLIVTVSSQPIGPARTMRTRGSTL